MDGLGRPRARGLYPRKSGQLDGDSQAANPANALPSVAALALYLSKGDHAGSEAKPGVETSRSLRPVRSTV
jgi:hypothetical protein